jgi:hypothetical protein
MRRVVTGRSWFWRVLAPLAYLCLYLMLLWLPATLSLHSYGFAVSAHNAVKMDERDMYEQFEKEGRGRVL